MQRPAEGLRGSLPTYLEGSFGGFTDRSEPSSKRHAPPNCQASVHRTSPRRKPPANPRPTCGKRLVDARAKGAPDMPGRALGRETVDGRAVRGQRKSWLEGHRRPAEVPFGTTPPRRPPRNGSTEAEAPRQELRVSGTEAAAPGRPSRDSSSETVSQEAADWTARTPPVGADSLRRRRSGSGLRGSIPAPRRFLDGRLSAGLGRPDASGSGLAIPHGAPRPDLGPPDDFVERLSVGCATRGEGVSRP